jgi:putative peptide zinc metalloprotease protein
VPRSDVGGIHAEVRRQVRRRRRRAAGIDVWAEVDHELDPTAVRPRLHPDVERAVFTRRDGSRYGMLKTPRGPGYVRLSELDLAILDRMDGRRTVAELVVDRLGGSGSLELSAVTDLVEDLRIGGFLDEPNADVHARMKERVAARRGRVRLPGWARNFLATRKLEFPAADRFFRALHRMGGRIFFAPPAAAASVALAVAGVVGFVVLLSRGGYTLVGRSATSILVLYLVLLASTFIHESGHALACIHHGRRVNGAGFMLYLGLPAFYIETTDMWMAPRRARVVASAAGPFSDAVLAGGAALLALALPGSLAGAYLYRFAVMSYISLAKNLVPFLRLDGYYVLMDLLEETNIREASFAFAKDELPGKLVRRERLTRRQRLYAAYTGIALLAAAGAIALSVVFWGRVFRQAFRNAATGGPLPLLLITILLGLLLAPVVRLVIRGLWSAALAVRRLVPRVRKGARRRWRAEAVALLTRLPLSEPLPDEDLAELLEDLEPVRVVEGRWVFKEGDSPDRYYVVRSGAVEVVRDGDDRDQVVATLGRGEGFGEVALLEGTARTAGVRAVGETRLFAVGRGAFDRHLAGRLQVAEDVRRATVSPARLRGLAPFRHLADAELARIAGAARWKRVAPGRVIVRQGAEGRSFFVIASGRAEVIRDRRPIGMLGTGDHFGERALLTDEPRAATVRADTAVSLVEVDRSAFERILAGAFRRARIAPGEAMVRQWEH